MIPVKSKKIIHSLETSSIKVASLKNLLSIFLQMGLLALTVHLFQIEADLELPQFFPLLCIFFALHTFTPTVFRPLVFFSSFIFTLAYFCGEIAALKMLLMGTGILGICHLPLSIELRKLLVFCVGFVLALMVLGIIWSPLETAQMRIFGTLLMFRVILYLHEIEYEKEEISIWQRLNYFFLLPNIIFPLFPIVDYKSFSRKYYDEPAHIIYQKGVNLILWSFLCLLFYRFLYHFVVPDVTQLYGIQEITLYVFSTYLTVIRLVGLLGLAVGILRLFGYNLPRIFNHMFLADSFAELFRRVNIYWKNFLMKICYYPTYFRFRKINSTLALTVATLVTFFFTWFFHIYQWFWILGTNPIRETSLIYWGTFGLIATINTLFENKKNKNQINHKESLAFLHTGKVMVTFSSMALLYSLWVSPTWKEWLVMMVTAWEDSLDNWLSLISALGIIYIVGVLAFTIYTQQQEKIEKIEKGFIQYKSFLNIGILFILIVIGTPQQNTSGQITTFVQNEQLNSNDLNEEYTGYYSSILSRNFNIGSRKLAKSYIKETKRPDKFVNLDIVRKTDNVVGHEFIPNSTSTFKGKPISVNRWGFRDKDYEKKPSANTIRIALVGSSPAMGSGVSDEEVFEALLEKRLNLEYGNDSLHFEILNFAQSSLCSFHFAYMVENKIKDFQPDYLLITDHCRTASGYSVKIKRIFEQQRKIYPELNTFLHQNNINLEEIATETQKEEKGWLIAEFGYNHLMAVCQKNEIEPIWTFIPPVSKDDFHERYEELVIKAGYSNRIKLTEIYKNYSQKILQVSPEDKHPNAQAHKLIADQLFNKIKDYLPIADNNVQE